MLALVALSLFVAGRCLVPMDETDLFFNLRLGEIVLDSHTVPTTNLLSYTHPTAPDVNLAWVFQIVLALAYRAAGIPGTVLLKTAFVVATWGTLFVVARRRGAHPAAAALVLALAAWAAEPRFVERPHLVTFLGLALLLLGLERAEAGRPRMLWAFVPAGLLWANANSCFFLAPAILFLYAGGAALEGRTNDARRAAWVGLAMVPFMFATPSGLGCLGYIANHFRMPWLRPLEEYRRARWPVDGPFFFLVAGAIAAAAARRLPLRWLFPLAALAVLGALRIRFVAEFAILAAPALAVAVSHAALRDRWIPAAAALLLVLTVFPRVEKARAGGKAFDLGIEEGLVPFAAIDFIDRNDLRAHLYNDMEVGSYLAWQGWPRHRVFQDPRINGYPPEFHAVMRRQDLGRDEWQRLLDRFAVDAALITYPDVNPRGALFSAEDWALVYRDVEALVFTRRTPARAALIGERELPLTFTFSTATGLTPRALADPPVASTVAACEWQRRLAEFHRLQGDDRGAEQAYERALATLASCPAARQGELRRAAGALHLRLGHADRALTLFADFQDDEARTNRGYALIALGRPAEALGELSSSSDEATFGRGLALQSLGRVSEARAAFEALLARSPHHLAVPEARRRLEQLRAYNRP